MPRAAAPKEEEEQPSLLKSVRWGRFTFWLITGALVMVGTLFAWHRTEEFLIKDDRFRIPETEDFAGQSPNLKVEGVRYASPSQVRHVFAEDFGRSLYLVPLQQRRSQLMAIDWVEDASISKIWPNAVRVDVHERRPVMFVRLTTGRKETPSLALIDRDGYILRPRVRTVFTLQVISGVREDQPIEERRLRVRRVLSMLHAIGPMTDNIAEVNAADPNNLLASEKVNGDVVDLMMGDDNYADRLRNFVANYAEIKAKRPEAKLFDLRVDGAITAIAGESHGQQ